MTLPILLDLNAAVLFVAVATFVTFRRPPEPMWPSLLGTQLLALVWIAGDIGTHLARDLFWEQFWISVIYAGSYGLLACWWVLGFRFAETHGVRPRWAKPSVVWAPAAFAFVTWLGVTTNPLHGQFLTPVLGARNEYHWMWWAAALTAYGLVLSVATGYGLLYRHFEKQPHPRRQSLVMLIATAAVLVSNSIYTLAPVDWPIDVSVAGGLIAGLLFVVGTYRGTLFDLSPVMVRDLLNRDPTGLLIVDRKGRLVYANPPAHELFEPAGLVLGGDVEPGLRCVLHPLDANDPPVSLSRVWTELDDRDYAGAFYLAHRGREDTRLWVTAQPLAQPGKKAEALIIRVHDMTRIYDLEADKRAIERRLAQTDRLRSLGALSAGIAHEVNNPVSSALLAAEFAEHTLANTDDPQTTRDVATEALTTVIEQIDRAARVTRAMLRFAREGGGVRVEGDLREIVAQASQFTRELARQHDAIVGLEMCEVAPVVLFNPTEMEQVLVNLIHNAIVSGKPGRRVDVRVELRGRRARVTVADDGNGMTREQCERAFEPFYSSRSDSSGTGLGLSVVHGIVTDCGGEVWLESEPGLGTRAIVELPIARPEPDTSRATSVQTGP